MKHSESLRIVIILTALLGLTILSCAGLSNVPNLLATPTLTATNTLTPTPTATLTSTPTLTPTSTFTPTPLPEASTEQLSDGSTRFTDRNGGYTFVLPEGWLVINFVSDDPEQALEAAKEANPDKALILNNLSNAMAQKARMWAADFSPEHFTAASAPILFTALDKTTVQMPLKDLLETNRQLLPQILKAKVTASEIKENSSGVSYGVLDVILKITANNKTASINEKLMMFKTDQYTVILTLAVIDELKQAGFGDFSEIIESVELLDS